MNKKLFTLLIIMSCIFILHSTYAAEEKSEDKPPSEPSTDATTAEELDISDLKIQFWKPHDKELEVVQNKTYTKENKFEVSSLFGIYQSVDFQETKTFGCAFGYHFNDTFGVEAIGYKMFSQDSHVLSRFQETRGATIEFNKELYYVGVEGLFTPIYGKFSLLGKKISHFEIYITPGAGVTRTTSLRPTATLGIGEKFWIYHNWNLRVEYRWQRYTDQIETNEGITAKKNGGPGYYEDTIYNQNLLMGISFLFN